MYYLRRWHVFANRRSFVHTLPGWDAVLRAWISAVVGVLPAVPSCDVQRQFDVVLRLRPVPRQHLQRRLWARGMRDLRRGSAPKRRPEELRDVRRGRVFLQRKLHQVRERQIRTHSPR